jgi:hypothetical protein
MPDILSNNLPVVRVPLRAAKDSTKQVDVVNPTIINVYFPFLRCLDKFSRWIPELTAVRVKERG